MTPGLGTRDTKPAKAWFSDACKADLPDNVVSQIPGTSFQLRPEPELKLAATVNPL